jgi:hypothetical protein
MVFAIRPDIQACGGHIGPSLRGLYALKGLYEGRMANTMQ